MDVNQSMWSSDIVTSRPTPSPPSSEKNKWFIYDWKFWIGIAIAVIIIVWIVVTFIYHPKSSNTYGSSNSRDIRDMRDPDRRRHRRRVYYEDYDDDYDDDYSDDEYEDRYEYESPPHRRPYRNQHGQTSHQSHSQYQHQSQYQSQAPLSIPVPTQVPIQESQYVPQPTVQPIDELADTTFEGNTFEDITLTQPTQANTSQANASMISTRTIDTCDDVPGPMRPSRNIDFTPDIPDYADHTGRKAERWKREGECRRILETIYGLPFPKVHPEWLVNDLTGHVMELDGYCEPLNIAFEHMGRQHYDPDDNYNKSDDEYKALIYRDNLKARICKERGIYLYVIPYNIPFNQLENFIRHNMPEVVAAREARERQLATGVNPDALTHFQQLGPKPIDPDSRIKGVRQPKPIIFRGSYRHR